MQIFYSKSLNEDLIRLEKDESRHCARVLRMREQQRIGVVDGAGTLCIAELLDVNPDSTIAKVIDRKENFGARPFSLHLAVAPTKNIDRFEWLLEKSTECGIDEITPVICEKSERRVIKPQRLEKILLSAMKQSVRAYLPRLNPAVKLEHFLNNPFNGTAVIAHCGEGKRSNLQNTYTAGGNLLILVGPEGDFSGEEVDLALEQGYRAISIGQHRLRTETAALTLCIQANTMNGLLI